MKRASRVGRRLLLPALTPSAARSAWVAGAVPGVAIEHAWQGPGLRAAWKSSGKRSAFLGRFSR